MLIFDQLKKNDPQLRWLAAGVFAGMFVLLAGLWWVQIVSARDYQRSLETQSFRTVRVPAIRGKILDRNGTVLAENKPIYNANLYLEDLSGRFRKEYARLRPLRTVTNSVPFWKRWLGVSAIRTQRVRLSRNEVEDLESQARYDVASSVVHAVSEALQAPVSLDYSRFTNHYASRRFMPYTIVSNLNAVEIARFEEKCAAQPSLDLDVESRRVYPYGTTAAHVLGYLLRNDNSIKGEDAFFFYRLPDYQGVVGIEGGYDRALHGLAGTESVLVNSAGYRQTEDVWTPVEPGKNVVLTIDLPIQHAAEEALRRLGPSGADTRGAAVVMGVHTGDILALASSPTYDPNWFIPRLSPADSKWLSNPQLRPEINRATQAIYAPGSIFKPIVGLACLQAGLDPNATIDNPGYIIVGHRIGDLAPVGEYNFRRAIMESCNTYFITNGMKAGIENIVKLGEELHLGERIGLPTRQESAGYFPSLRRVHSHWYAGDTANLCIGQGFIAVTPLQMAVMTAALANGGNVLWPRLVARIESPDPASGEPPTVFPKGRVRDHLDVSPRNFQILKAAMLAEVEDSGTGRRAMIPGLRICGKTGTAQVMDEHNRQIGKTTWFISFAPYEQPKYAVVVMVEDGIFGGTTCAPMAREIYLAILRSERTTAKGETLAQAK